MMPCRMIDTDYEALDGRPIVRCANPGCELFGYGTPQSVVSPNCKSPHFALGDAVANTIKKASRGKITEATWPRIKRFWTFAPELADEPTEKICSSCARKRKDWNRWYTRPLPYLVYRFLVWRGYRKELPPRLDGLFAAGKIRRRRRV